MKFIYKNSSSKKITYPCQVKYYMKCYRILIRKPNCYTKFNYEVNQSKKITYPCQVKYFMKY